MSIRDDWAQLSTRRFVFLDVRAASRNNKEISMSLTKNSIRWDHVNKWLGRTGVEMKWQPYGMPNRMNPYHTRFSVIKPRPPWNVPKKAFISAAITGRFHSKKSNPNHPITLRETQNSA